MPGDNPLSDTTVPATTPDTSRIADPSEELRRLTAPAADPGKPADAAEPKPFDEAYVKALRSEAASYREKLRIAEAAEAKRKEAEDAAKLAELSEIDRLKAQLADANAKARTLEVQAVRTKAALAHSLPEDLHEFLTAEDEAGALAQAEKLAARLKADAKPVPAPLPPSGSRQPAHTEQPAGFTPEQQRANDKRMAATW
jgi:hypothetical protein